MFDINWRKRQLFELFHYLDLLDIPKRLNLIECAGGIDFLNGLRQSLIETFFLMLSILGNKTIPGIKLNIFLVWIATDGNLRNPINSAQIILDLPTNLL